MPDTLPSNSAPNSKPQVLDYGQLPPYNRLRRWIERIAWTLLVLLVLGGMAIGWVYWEWRSEQQAIAVITKSGGNVYVENTGPCWLQRVIRVCLDCTKATDKTLAHLKGLPQLERLTLFDTNITDAGLIHVQGLTRLMHLNLARTKITDAGLVKLKGLTQLRYLNLYGTMVTEQGVKDLQKALPKCSIHLE